MAQSRSIMARKQHSKVGGEAAAERLLRLARQCRAQDLRQLAALAALVAGIDALVHALQKERGASSIFLGSGGRSFAARRAERAADSGALEAPVRGRLERFDEQPGAGAGARFYRCGAHALQALDALPQLRARIQGLACGADEAIRGFSDVIAALLAVSIETADVAADPLTSRAIVALASFSQGKEYAGQERATGGAVLSRGRIEAGERRRLQCLATAQEQAFGIFGEFAAPACAARFAALAEGAEWSAVMQLRQAFAAVDAGTAPAAAGAADSPVEAAGAAAADRWYEVATRRIDAMKSVEDDLTAELDRACAQALTDAGSAGAEAAGEAHAGIRAAAVAMLVTDADPEANGLGLSGGVGLYALDGVLPRPMRSILDVLSAQSRRIDAVSTELDTARAALAERKLIEKAKGLLMKAHKLSEGDAYAVMREMAMRQHRRLAEVARAVIGMAEGAKS